MNDFEEILYLSGIDILEEARMNYKEMLEFAIQNYDLNFEYEKSDLKGWKRIRIWNNEDPSSDYFLSASWMFKSFKEMYDRFMNTIWKQYAYYSLKNDMDDELERRIKKAPL